MRINGICIVKDEDDIIGDVLIDASKWADRIFVADNGSKDNTVEAILTAVKHKKNIQYLGVFDEPFTDAIRGKLFNCVSNVSEPGDWWCRLDADEFYIDDPRDFLARVPLDVDNVWGASYQFYFTDIDYIKCQSDSGDFIGTPLEHRFAYYLNNWSEPRFAKHTTYFNWPINSAWPLYMVSCADKRIRLRTYQHRSPEQIVKRLEIRNEVLARTDGQIFSHILNNEQSNELKQKIGVNEPETSNQVDFKQVIKDHSCLDNLASNGVYIAREDLMPALPTRNPMIPSSILYHIERSKVSVKQFAKKQLLLSQVEENY